MMEFTARKLNEEDWRIFSEMRLKALRTDPQAFGSNFDLEVRFTENDWRNRLQPDDSAIFMVFANETPIGMTGVSVWREDATNRTAIFWGSWLEPEFRRRNLSDLIYKTRLEWVKARALIERIIVAHRASNVASKYANQKHGFVFTHAQEITWSDGINEDVVSYELKIKS